MRYSVISYLNEAERYATFGSLFETLVDDTAVSTYAQRLWDFFQGLFKTSFSKIFDLFGIQEEFQPYLDSITQALKESTRILLFLLTKFYAYFASLGVGNAGGLLGGNCALFGPL